MRLSQSIAILLLPLKAMACGLDWSEPVSQWPGASALAPVDFQGNVHIVRKLGEVEKLPIYLIFNSSFGNSPYAGSGFEIPILQSRMWQVDENRFQMKSPSGWLWIFQRTKNPNVLEGNAGWKGLIKNDTITLWAPCGDKLFFKNGKIVSMQLKDEKFDYAYKDNRVESIQMNGRTVLEVKSDDKTGDVTGISPPNTRELIGLQQTGSRPMVETVGDTSVVSRMDKTLGEITKSTGSKGRFEFGVDEKINPTLKLNDTSISWNSTTKAILKDGDWSYQITPRSGILENAVFTRVNPLGQKEAWDFDGARGQETVESVTGSKVVKCWFTSGKLAGKMRYTTHFLGSRKIDDKHYSYDDVGRLIRIKSNEELIFVAEYDASGALISKKESGRLTKWKSLPNGDQEEEVILSNGRKIYRIISSSGKLIDMRIDPSPKTEILERLNPSFLRKTRKKPFSRIFAFASR